MVIRARSVCGLESLDLVQIPKECCHRVDVPAEDLCAGIQLHAGLPVVSLLQQNLVMLGR